MFKPNIIISIVDDGFESKIENEAFTENEKSFLIL